MLALYTVMAVQMTNRGERRQEEVKSKPPGETTNGFGSFFLPLEMEFYFLPAPNETSMIILDPAVAVEPLKQP